MAKKKYEDLSDEELLELYRKYDDKARDVLSVRYFRMRHSIWDSVFPEGFDLIDEWDMNECFFSAYLAAEAKFKKDKDIKFLTYFCQILKYNALSMVRDYYKEKHFRDAVSLDAEISSVEDDEKPSFADTVPSSDDDPVSFVNKEEILAEIGKTPISDIEDWKEAMLICMEGYGTVATCELLDQEAHSLRRRVKAAKEHLKKWLKKQQREIGTDKEEIKESLEEDEDDEDEE